MEEEDLGWLSSAVGELRRDAYVESVSVWKD